MKVEPFERRCQHDFAALFRRLQEYRFTRTRVGVFLKVGMGLYTLHRLRREVL